MSHSAARRRKILTRQIFVVVILSSVSHCTGYYVSRRLKVGYETLRLSATGLLTQNQASFVYSDVDLNAAISINANTLV